MISGIEGGKIGPTMAEAQVSAPANSRLKPCESMALTSMRPSPPMSAKAAPLIPEKMRLPTMLTWARPSWTRVPGGPVRLRDESRLERVHVVRQGLVGEGHVGRAAGKDLPELQPG